MKRANHLFERITVPDNLRTAFLKAARGKSGRAEVIDYRANLNRKLLDLRSHLITGDVRVGDYRYFTVHDPKLRRICAASFEERVLHHAIMNVCEPLFEKRFIQDTYACRVGKGQQACVLRAQQFSRRWSWYLKLDIRRFFDSIDHNLLLKLLERLMKDISLLSLFHRIVTSYETAPGKGLPIGNLISQHCANLYLGELDHYLKDGRGINGYLRYMDDFLLFGGSKGELKEHLKKLTQFLDAKLGLSLKDNIQLNRCDFGIPFLGYRVFPGEIRLGRSSKRRFREKFAQYESRFLHGEWDEAQLACHMEPLVEFCRFARSGKFRGNVLQMKGRVWL